MISQEAWGSHRQRTRVAAGVRPAAPILLLSPALLLLLLFAVSFGVLLLYSTYEFAGGRLQERVTWQAYVRFFTDPYYWQLLLETLRLSALVTAITLLVGYPTAYALTKVRSRGLSMVAYLILFSPLLVSVVVRAYGWLLLLSDQGIVNYVLVGIGLVREPVRLIQNFTGVTISMVHILMPFMVFPILSVLTQMDPALREASMDLGAGPLKTFWKVTFPLSLPGVAAGVQVVFSLSAGAYVSPALLGGGRVHVLAPSIYRSVIDINWPLAGVLSLVLLAVALMVLLSVNVWLRATYAQR